VGTTLSKDYYLRPLIKVIGQNDARDLGVREKKVKEQAAPRVCLFSLYISIELCVLLPKLGKAGCGKFGRSAHMIVESVQPCSTSVVQCTRRDAASARWQAGVSKHSKPLLSLHPASSGLHA